MKKKIKSFFVEDDLQVLLGWIGINYKRAMRNRIQNSIILFLIFLGIGIAVKNFYFLLLALFVSILYYKMQYYLTKNQRKKLIQLKKRMFPSMVKKLLILLRTNNIYISLNKLIDFTDDPIKKYLVQLVKEIDEDKSVRPYVNFANNMEFIEAYQVIIMLYTFAEKSMNQDHLNSLESMIVQLYENEIDDMIESKKRLMWLYPNYVILTMLVMIFALAGFMFMDIMKEVSFS